MTIGNTPRPLNNANSVPFQSTSAARPSTASLDNEHGIPCYLVRHQTTQPGVPYFVGMSGEVSRPRSQRERPAGAGTQRQLVWSSDNEAATQDDYLDIFQAPQANPAIIAAPSVQDELNRIYQADTLFCPGMAEPVNVSESVSLLPSYGTQLDLD